MSARVADLVGNLHALADFLDLHPELPAPYITTSDERPDVSWFLQIRGNEADQKAMAAQIVSALGGKWDRRDHYRGLFAVSQDRPEFHMLIQADVELEAAAVAEVAR